MRVRGQPLTEKLKLNKALRSSTISLDSVCVVTVMAHGLPLFGYVLPAERVVCTVCVLVRGSSGDWQMIADWARVSVSVTWFG